MPGREYFHKPIAPGARPGGACPVSRGYAIVDGMVFYSCMRRGLAHQDRDHHEVTAELL